MAETRFGVRLVFGSDWHVGFGAGRHGAVDRAVVTDPDGLPYVPAKTVVGILRDHAEIAASALDSGVPGVWASWVEALFGSQPGQRGVSGVHGRPRPAALQAVPLRLPAATRQLIGSMPLVAAQGRVLTHADLVRATTVVRAGVRIDAETGTAVNESLRLEQRARAGLTVEGSWAIVHPEGFPVWPAALLLRAAATLTRQIGGKRRRGAGAVDVVVDGLPALQQLRTQFGDDAPAPWPDRVDTLPQPRRSVEPVEAGLRHAWDLVITAVQPVVVDNGLWGNIVRTSTRIPGSMLLPLLRGAVGVQRLADLVRAEQVIVTDACLQVCGARGLAWPRALVQSKDAHHDDTAVLNTLHRHRENPRLRPKASRYVSPDCRTFGEVAITQGIHAVIADDAQRPTTSTGGLFVYEGIAAGTVLRANVLLPEGVDLDGAAIEGLHRVGRSSKDDYGLVRVELAPAPSNPQIPTPVAAATAFTVWAVSDLLLRTERGGPDTSPAGLAAALGAALGVAGAVSVAQPGTETEPGTVVSRVEETLRSEVTRRQSWHRGWGLPRPSTTAIVAGSVFVFHTSEPFDGARIRHVQDHGVGERTVEGFGRVLINPAALTLDTLDIRPAPTPVPEVGESGLGEVGDSVLTAAWHAVIARIALVAAATGYRNYLRASVTRAQLGNLRDNLAELSGSGGRRAAAVWVERVRESDSASDWGRDNLDLIEALLCTDPGSVDHPVWPLLFGTTPTDLPSERSALAVFAVQSVWAEMVRIAARQQEN